MSSSDTFNVTASWNQGSYQAGQTIIGTISGNDVLTAQQVTLENVGPVVVPIVAADGAQSTVTTPPVQVEILTTSPTPESVVIDTTRAIVDNGNPARTWTVSADKLSISATA